MRYFNQELFSYLINKAKGDDRSLSQLADKCGLSRSYLTKLRNGSSNCFPSWGVLYSLANSSRGSVNLDDLEKAAGYQHYTAENSETCKGISKEDVYRYPDTELFKSKVPIFKYIKTVDFFNEINAVSHYEYIGIKKKDSNLYFGLILNDNSLSPRFSEGDIAIFMNHCAVGDGDFAVVLQKGKFAAVRKIQITEKGMLFIPLNSEIPVSFCNRENINKQNFYILGRVIEIRASL